MSKRKFIYLLLKLKINKRLKIGRKCLITNHSNHCSQNNFYKNWTLSIQIFNIIFGGLWQPVSDIPNQHHQKNSLIISYNSPCTLHIHSIPNLKIPFGNDKYLLLKVKYILLFNFGIFILQPIGVF